MTATGDMIRLGARGKAAKALCVFVHGRGQSPEAMEEQVISRLTVTEEVAFLLPRAPRGAWYDARAVDPLTETARAQLTESLDLLGGHIAALRAELPGLPLLLGGFSQGGCLSLEYAFAGRPAPDALAALTGCRVGVPADGRPSALARGLPVYLTGGDDDPWIPVAAMAAAAGELGRAGAHLRSDVFPGRGHEVSDTEAAMLDLMLTDLAQGRPAMMGRLT